MTYWKYSMQTSIKKARDKLEAKGIVPKTKVKVNEKRLKEKDWIEIFKQIARDLNYVE